ncbi:hypothetical protein X559_1845 [Paenilisteria newyorkensis]|nr:hypothetical protein X559_1845 [Listeria newyorkensis]
MSYGFAPFYGIIRDESNSGNEGGEGDCQALFAVAFFTLFTISR